MKETCAGEFVELGFSQNLTQRPNGKVQSVHFSRRQFTLHCTIVETTRCIIINI